MKKTSRVAWVTHSRVLRFYEFLQHSETKHFILSHPVLWTVGVKSGQPGMPSSRNHTQRQAQQDIFFPLRITKNKYLKATAVSLQHRRTSFCIKATSASRYLGWWCLLVVGPPLWPWLYILTTLSSFLCILLMILMIHWVSYVFMSCEAYPDLQNLSVVGHFPTSNKSKHKNVRWNLNNILLSSCHTVTCCTLECNLGGIKLPHLMRMTFIGMVCKPNYKQQRLMGRWKTMWELKCEKQSAQPFAINVSFIEGSSVKSPYSVSFHV